MLAALAHRHKRVLGLALQRGIFELRQTLDLSPLLISRHTRDPSQIIPVPGQQKPISRGRREPPRNVFSDFLTNKRLPTNCCDLCHAASIVEKPARVNTRLLPRVPAPAPKSRNPQLSWRLPPDGFSEVPISRAIKKLDNGGHDVNGLLGAALSRARACAKSCQFSSVELQRFVERALFPLPLRFATDRLRVTDVTGFVLSSVV